METTRREVEKQATQSRTLRSQRNGPHVLTVKIDGVRLRIMANGKDERARKMLADMYRTQRLAIVYTEHDEVHS